MTVLRTNFGDHHALLGRLRDMTASDLRSLSPPTRQDTPFRRSGGCYAVVAVARCRPAMECGPSCWCFGAGGARCGRGQWRSFVKLRFLGALGDGMAEGRLDSPT